MKNKDAHQICGLIISAGLSGRMNAFKPLLIFKEKSFLINIMEKLSTVCEKIIVVTGYKKEEIERHLNEALPSGLKNKTVIVHNELYELGMFSSLKRGLKHCTNSDWVIYHFVDQPTIPKEFYPEFVNQTEKNYDWIQPVNKGRKGHPVLLGKKIRNAIISAENDSTLRQISSGDLQKKFWQCDYDEIFCDIDKPEEYLKIK